MVELDSEKKLKNEKNNRFNWTVKPFTVIVISIFMEF